MSIRLLSVFLLALGVAACSGTTFRHDTYTSVRIDEREMFVSWIWLGPDELDLAVFEEPALDQPDALPDWRPDPTRPPPPQTHAPRLDARLARAAAEQVAKEKCGWWNQRAVRLGPEAAFAGGRRYAYRASCVPTS